MLTTTNITAAKSGSNTNGGGVSSGGGSFHCGNWNTDTYVAFVEFDLSSVPVGDLVSATMQFTLGNGVNISRDIYRATSAWDEGGSPPSFDSSTTYGSIITSADITTLVDLWRNETYTNFGMRIHTTNGGTAYTTWKGRTDSIESERPKLAVATSTIPDTPTSDSPSNSAQLYADEPTIFQFDATHPLSGVSTSAYALKVTIDSVDRWWKESDSTWQASEYWNSWVTSFPANNKQVSVGAGTLFDTSGSGSWSVAVKDTDGDFSIYSATRTFTITPTGGLSTITEAGIFDLFARNVASTGETSVYVSGSSVRTIVKQVILTNLTASAATFSISHVPSGGAAGDNNRLFKKVSVAANSKIKADCMWVLNPDDFISVKQDTAGAINIAAYGYTQETS